MGCFLTSQGRVASRYSGLGRVPMITLYHAFKGVFLLKQDADEDLADFAKRLKQKFVALEQLVGDSCLDKFRGEDRRVCCGIIAE